MKVENAAGRIVETEIAGKTIKPFAGAKKHTYISKVTSLTDALKKCGIKDGDTILTACVDHGVTPPTAMASRVVASGGVPLPTAVAAGVLSIGDAHGGAIDKGAKFLQEGIARLKEEGKSIDEIAKILVTESREQNKRILGFGHRIHTSDPRTKKLFNLADELGITGDCIALSKAIEKELVEQTGKNLPINVDGAIAAISSDMGFDWRLGKAFFLLGRVAGLTAHVYEEQTEQKPMRKMFTVDVEYNGIEEKEIP